jgi:hypothetical protein
MFKDRAESKPFVESVKIEKNLLIDGLNKFLLD